MAFVLEQLVLADRLASESLEALRWAPMTMLFVLASSTWVKGPLFVAVAATTDFRSGRRLPTTALFAAATAVLASLAAAGLKEVFDRERPPLADPDVDPLVGLPSSPSFPSGHAATAFAAAALVGALRPRLRVPLYAVAALVALSRVYLGVHYWLDVIAGAALGIAIGLAGAWAWRRLAQARHASA